MFPLRVQCVDGRDNTPTHDAGGQVYTLTHYCVFLFVGAPHKYLSLSQATQEVRYLDESRGYTLDCASSVASTSSGYTALMA